MLLSVWHSSWLGSDIFNPRKVKIFLINNYHLVMRLVNILKFSLQYYRSMPYNYWTFTSQKTILFLDSRPLRQVYLLSTPEKVGKYNVLSLSFLLRGCRNNEPLDHLFIQHPAPTTPTLSCQLGTHQLP